MQGEGASKVDGRMVTVAMIYNPQPRQQDDEALSKPCDGVRYFAGFYDLDELGLQMRRQAGQVGMNDAEQWIAWVERYPKKRDFVAACDRDAKTVAKYARQACKGRDPWKRRRTPRR